MLRPRPRVCCLLALAALLAACGPFPRDPEDTLERVRGGELLAGASHDPPWVRLDRGAPQGREVELVEQLAASLGARVRWTPGGQDELLERLHRHELDVVVGGLLANSPWKGRIALSAPHARTMRDGRRAEHVLALPPGENAWRMHVDQAMRRARQAGQ